MILAGKSIYFSFIICYNRIRKPYLPEVPTEETVSYDPYRPASP
jgi:hypothetical protein